MIAAGVPNKITASIDASAGLPITLPLQRTPFTLTSAPFQPAPKPSAVQVRASKVVTRDDTAALGLNPEHETRSNPSHVRTALADDRWTWLFATPGWKAKAATIRPNDVTGTIQRYEAIARMARERIPPRANRRSPRRSRGRRRNPTAASFGGT